MYNNTNLYCMYSIKSVYIIVAHPTTFIIIPILCLTPSNKMDALKASGKLTVLLVLDSWAQLRSVPARGIPTLLLAQNLGRVTSSNETGSLVSSLTK